MNGQKLNRYKFSYVGADTELIISTGDELKGLTDTVFEVAHIDGVEDWEATFEGGLENVVKNLDGEIRLHFIDFRPEGQGIRLILDAWGDGYVFQASILM